MVKDWLLSPEIRNNILWVLAHTVSQEKEEQGIKNGIEAAKLFLTADYTKNPQESTTKSVKLFKVSSGRLQNMVNTQKSTVLYTY